MVHHIKCFPAFPAFPALSNNSAGRSIDRSFDCSRTILVVAGSIGPFVGCEEYLRSYEIGVFCDSLETTSCFFAIDVPNSNWLINRGVYFSPLTKAK